MTTETTTATTTVNTNTNTSYSLPLKRRTNVAEGTLEFAFDKPKELGFKAGQFMEVTLIDPPETDAEGNTRVFSITSAPRDDELTFATRLRDTAFKRVLKSAPLETRVKLDGPFGSFTLHNNPKRAAVLLAGGIGITPFLSIARRAAQDRLDHRIYLFYGNKRPEDAPFIEELRALAQENRRFTFVPTMDKMAESKLPWGGETGRIDAALIAKYLNGANASEAVSTMPIYYMAGPPGMVAALRTVLSGIGVDEDDIRTEEFAGY